MRAILATVIYCVFAVASAQAHSGHHHQSPRAAAMVVPGLLHMPESMAKPRAQPSARGRMHAAKPHSSKTP
jgi:hypothetical protein